MSQKPVSVIKLGRIKGTIWMNETEHGPRHNVQIVRLYRAGEQWKHTTSFRREDLPLVAKVADMAHTAIFELGK